MTNLRTPQQVREEADILRSGRWYIAEIEDPALAAQGESEADARQKLAKRYEEYTAEPETLGGRAENDEDEDERSEHLVTPY